jgi:ATP-dependent Clp protease ATP-binding subunit ClpB
VEATSTPSLLILPTKERTVLRPHWSKEQNDFRNWLDIHLAGQEDAKNEATEVLGQIRNPLRDMTKPVDSFILAGPSTTGKTELFKLLVEWVNGDAKHMLFFSGSDFKEQHQIQKLIGAPHGYLGFVDIKDPRYVAPKEGEKDTSAELSQHNLNNSILGAKSEYIFILFDEWEKFHSAFNEFILRPLREGNGQANNGAIVDFRKVVFGFTSNIGSKEMERALRGYGFNANHNPGDATVDMVRDVVIPEIIKFVPQEFRNRINRIIVFRSLRKDESLRLVETHLEKVRSRVFHLKAERQFFFSVSDAAKEFLLRDTDPVEGKDTKNRIPKLQERIERFVVIPLGQLMDQVEFDRNAPTDADSANKDRRAIKPGDKVNVEYREGDEKLSFERVEFEGITDLELKIPGVSRVEGDAAHDASPANDGGTVLKKVKKPASAESRKRAKAARQPIHFEIHADFGEDLIAGRQAVLVAIKSHEGACRLMGDSTDYENGGYACVVLAPYAVMVHLKEQLASEKLNVRIHATL